MVILNKILKYPLYFVLLFTQAKSFKANPIIGSVILNVMGLHIIRLLIARGIFKFKLLLLMPLASKADRDFYAENGYLLKENILSEDDFESLRQDVLSFDGEVKRSFQGDSLVYRAFLDSKSIEPYKYIQQFIYNNKISKLLRYTSGKNETARHYIEQVIQGEGNKGSFDAQKKLHSDSFHPTMKAWFFLQDVEISDGPFNYCVGSNRLGWRRLKWEYAKSVKGKFNNDGYSEKGSFRAFDEDLKQLNLNSPKKILVKKNTLVIANTNGFHCRGDAEGGASRTSIFVSSRVNPFNIFPGINSITLSNIREKILIKYNIYKANQAKKINSRPPWHVVEGIKFTIKD